MSIPKLKQILHMNLLFYFKADLRYQNVHKDLKRTEKGKSTMSNRYKKMRSGEYHCILRIEVMTGGSLMI